MRRWKDSAKVYFPFTPLANATKKSIYAEFALVNMRQQNPASYQSDESGRRRASVTFQPGGPTVIRLFNKEADISSIPYEAAHIFMEDLPGVEPVTEEKSISFRGGEGADFRLETTCLWMGKRWSRQKKAPL